MTEDAIGPEIPELELDEPAFEAEINVDGDFAWVTITLNPEVDRSEAESVSPPRTQIEIGGGEFYHYGLTAPVNDQSAMREIGEFLLDAAEFADNLEALYELEDADDIESVEEWKRVVEQHWGEES